MIVSAVKVLGNVSLRGWASLYKKLIFSYLHVVTTKADGGQQDNHLPDCLLSLSAFAFSVAAQWSSM